MKKSAIDFFAARVNTEENKESEPILNTKGVKGRIRLGKVQYESCQTEPFGSSTPFLEYNEKGGQDVGLKTQDYFH